MGHFVSDITREKISKKNKGRKLSEEHKKKVSESLKGEKAYWYGKKLPEEIREKLSLAKLGKKLSFEHRQKISEGHKGKKLSEVTRYKISQKALERLRNGNYSSWRQKSPSKTEKSWGDLVERIFDITLEPSFWVEGRCFDFRFNNYLFEIDGGYYHSFEESVERDELKNRIAIDNGYIIYRFNADNSKEAVSSIRENMELLQNIFKGSFQKNNEAVWISKYEKLLTKGS